MMSSESQLQELTESLKQQQQQQQQKSAEQQQQQQRQQHKAMAQQQLLQSTLQQQQVPQVRSLLVDTARDPKQFVQIAQQLLLLLHARFCTLDVTADVTSSVSSGVTSTATSPVTSAVTLSITSAVTSEHPTVAAACRLALCAYFKECLRHVDGCTDGFGCTRKWNFLEFIV